MKRFYLFQLAILCAIAGCTYISSAQTTVFNFNGTTGTGNAGVSGTVQTYTVPPNVVLLGIDAIGAAGGMPYTNGTSVTKSLGGRVQCQLTVTPGQILYIFVGGQGGDDGVGFSGGSIVNGGWNGGQNSHSYAGASAGATDIRFANDYPSYTASDRVIVAGGGGAGGDWYAEGGNGGGLTGQQGFTTSSSGGTGGSGGTQTGPGPTGGAMGSLGTGGYSGSYYGAGGGGYWGGNTGIGEGGGGGGSSYTNPTYCAAVVHTQGYVGANGNGKVTITVLCTPASHGRTTGHAVGGTIGAASACTGAVSAIADSGATTGGLWKSLNTAVATVDSASGNVTGVSVGTAILTYSTLTNCPNITDTVIVTVNPAVTSVTGTANICTATPATFIGLPAGGAWSSSNTTVAGVGSTGIVSGYTPGLATITYTLPQGCFGTFGVTAYTSPQPISGTPTVCAGLSTTLSDVTTGGAWSSSNTAVANINSVSGVTTGASAGNATITYTMPTGGCYQVANVTVNPLPAVNNVTATSGNSYCQGAGGLPIGLNGSTAGINYQLYNGGVAVAGGPVTGPGGAFSFGMQTAGGTYTAIATDPATGCTQNMAGSQTITVNPLPAVQSVTTPSGNSYCAGGTGVPVGISGSESGVNYTLWMGASNLMTNSGTGSSFIFAMETAGTYTVSAFNPATGCSNNMSGSATISATPLPSPYPVTVTGGGAFCSGGAGQHIRVSYTNSGVNYQLFLGISPVPGALVAGVNDSIDFGLITTGGTYNVVGINTTTGCQGPMSNTVNITVNPNPVNSFTVTGGGPYCSGGTGVPVGLSGSVSGVNYQLMRGSTAVVGAVASGSGGPVTFANQTLGGNYTVVGTDISTGCMSTMTGSQTVTVNSLPMPQTVTGGGNYCAGGTGVPVGVGGSEVGVNYELLLGGVPVVGAPIKPGTGGALSFGSYTGAGAYTVLATNTATTCTNTMSGTANIVINPLPAVFDVNGGGAYCVGGAGKHVGLSYSNTGVTYQLYNGGFAVGSGVAGTGSALDFGVQSAVGTYTVMATNNITGCSDMMNSSATISTNNLPTPYAISGGGGYCAGGTGVHVGLAASNTGIVYQLYNGTLPVGAALPGNGGIIDFGLQTANGVYTIVGTNGTTGCSNTMTGSETITVNPNPVAYSVSGGGGYCAGGTGVTIGLSNSDMGVNYVLWQGGLPASGTFSGSGGPLVFGSRTTAGAYSVMATDAVTGCTSTMSGVASVAVYPLPVVYTVLGSATICSGTGSHVTLSASNVGINYQLSNGHTAVGSPVGGTGSVIDFGSMTGAGNYTVMATDATTGCTAPMAGSAVLNVLPTPTAFTVTGGGSYCAGGVGPHIMLSSSERTATYQLYNGTTPVGIPWYGTGSAVDLGTYAIPGTYSIKAFNTASSSCLTTMLTSVSVSITPIAVPVVTVMDTVDHTVCAGVPVTFTANTTNGGSAPTYQWSVGGSPVAGATSSVYNYSPANGDVVSVSMTSNADCASPTMASGSEMMTVNANHAPAVTIMANPGNTVCAGTPVLYTASPIYGGTAPTYSWRVGSTTLGTGPTITYVPTNGDNVYVNMVSNYACLSGAAGTSDNITMTVNMQPAPAVTLSGKSNIGLHMNDTLTAIVTSGAGTSTSYEWLIDGTPVPGINSPMFVTSQFNNRDSVCVMVTAHGDCGNATTTKCMTMNVRDLGVKTVSSNSNVSVLPNPNTGMFTVKGTLASASDEEVTIEVTNMLGQVVYSGKTMTQQGAIDSQVQLNNVANGTYILTLRSETEQAIFHVVVEK